MNRGIGQYYDTEFKEKKLQTESGTVVRDLSGNEYPLQATITYDYDLNGNQSISFHVAPSNVNDLFIHNITEMWEVEDETTYKIIYCKKRGSGNKLNVEIKAIPVFFDTFDTQRIYEEYNEHMTSLECFNIIFDDSGYNFIVNGTFNAIQWEGFGAGDTRLTLFKKALNRYKAEFTISGNTIYLKNQIGRDTQFMYRYKLNASNIVQENDATQYWTYAKGYGNFPQDEWQNAKLIREYTSPLASIIGKREAPPIKNGSITTNDTMDKQLQTLVDDSLKISVAADIHDLKHYPLAQPQIGDRAFLIDERIGLEAEIRIQSLSITKDWKGSIIDIKAQFGSPDIVKRHQSNLQNAISNITQLLEGNLKLPFSALDNAVAEATKALQNAQTELQFPESGGILAIDKNNPNYVVLINSAGIGVSTDGGATFKNALTGLGLNASVITVGTMLFDRIKGGILSLGGFENGNGRMLVYNEDGDTIADLNAAEGGFDKLYVAEFSSPTVMNYSASRYEFYVRPGGNGDDSNDGLSYDTALRSISEALRRIPKQYDGEAFIYISTDYGAAYETIDLNGYTGSGTITIARTSTVNRPIVFGGMLIGGNTVHLRFEGLEYRGASTTDSCISIQHSVYTYFNNCVIDTFQAFGIRARRHSGVYIENSEVYSVENAIRSNSLAQVYILDTKGFAQAGLYAGYGGSIIGSGYVPAGSESNSVVLAGGSITGTFSYNSGRETPPPPTVVTKKQTWTNTSSDSWHGNAGVWDSTTNDVLQGQWGSSGPYRGLWFFGTGLRNTVNGKTIKQIRVKLKRSNNSGYSSSVKAVIRPHSYGSKPSGQPNFLGSSHTVGFRWGEEKWVTLPSSFHQYFENGSAYGIGLYTTNNSQYMRFTQKAQIEITWEE